MLKAKSSIKRKPFYYALAVVATLGQSHIDMMMGLSFEKQNDDIEAA
jgi:hypothetical protein